ncbi:hypothetical protein FKP32DRAFT_1690599 [Trametes sanguinea]|nr:hypothetical protein FKP32DRAFT_1690599 [Trametes sanguinea]
MRSPQLTALPSGLPVPQRTLPVPDHPPPVAGYGLRASPLRGLQIPGIVDRLVAKLFADDTTVFLHEEDDYGTMENETAVWCRGSRARFNDTKTEIVPIGSPSYRARVLNDRRLRPQADLLPNGVRVVPDGTAVRLLGAWVGNKVDSAAPWGRIVDTLEDVLARWGKRNPTLHGRKLIVGMEVAGRTQFLARAQGMPAAVEKRFTKMISDFMWKGGAPVVNAQTLQAPVAAGGLGLLDLRARNEAIDLVWLREYLELSDKRPLIGMSASERRLGSQPT